MWRRCRKDLQNSRLHGSCLLAANEREGNAGLPWVRFAIFTATGDLRMVALTPRSVPTQSRKAVDEFEEATRAWMKMRSANRSNTTVTVSAAPTQTNGGQATQLKGDALRGRPLL